jgi:hypothetical protein
MPRSDAIIILGTMCPMSVNGKPGMLTSHMWVDVTFVPLGRKFVIGLMAMFVFAVCAFHDEQGGCAGVRNGVRWVIHHDIGLVYAV